MTELPYFLWLYFRVTQVHVKWLIIKRIVQLDGKDYSLHIY